MFFMFSMLQIIMMLPKLRATLTVSEICWFIRTDRRTD